MKSSIFAMSEFGILGICEDLDLWVGDLESGISTDLTFFQRDRQLEIMGGYAVGYHGLVESRIGRSFRGGIASWVVGWLAEAVSLLKCLRIEADFCVQIRILQHFSRSTRFANLCTAPKSKDFKII